MKKYLSFALVIAFVVPSITHAAFSASSFTATSTDDSVLPSIVSGEIDSPTSGEYAGTFYFTTPNEWGILGRDNGDAALDIFPSSFGAIIGDGTQDNPGDPYLDINVADPGESIMYSPHGFHIQAPTDIDNNFKFNNSSNGIIMKDTASSTCYLVQITHGVLTPTPHSC